MHMLAHMPSAFSLPDATAAHPTHIARVFCGLCRSTNGSVMLYSAASQSLPWLMGFTQAAACPRIAT
jgi:hypothetical protein